jgi:hypothetical protein
MTATLRTALLLLLLTPAFSHAGPQTGSEDKAIFKNLPYPIEAALASGQKLGAVAFETPFSETPAAQYDTVLLQGVMSDPAVRVEIVVKGRTLVSPASVYAPASSRRFPNGRFWARFRVPLSRQPFKLRVVDLGAGPGAKLSFYESELLVESLSKEAPPAAPEKPYIPDPALSLPATAPFKIIRRAEWSAELPKSSYTVHQPYFFTLHHTQGNYPKTREAAVSEIQFVQDYHQNAKKWIDIGYHFLIDPAGDIFEGRPILVEGAHVLSHNTGNIGISIMGNYHPPVSNDITKASLDSFVTIGRYLKDAYTVNVSSFYAHRDIGNTDCPGDGLYAKKQELKDLIFNPQPVPVNAADAPQLTPAQQKALNELTNYLNRQ